MINNQVVLETHNLSKRYKIGTIKRLTLFSSLRYKLSGEYPNRELWALKDINISVNRGEMVVVIGPNGAGKSTLLKVLSGIMSHTSGSYCVYEEISCIFELGFGFNPMFTALENVYLYGALHGFSRKQVNKMLERIVEFSGLDEFMGAKLRDFSSGMRARLAFATIMQMVKGIIMVDEAMAVGDMSFKKKCLEEFQRLLNEGNTIIFISHDPGSIKNLCTRALYIDKGVQKEYGPAVDVIRSFESDMGNTSKFF
jgi:ABC-type polysaccharide/polyol phosphate transport system ATPase subunit